MRRTGAIAWVVTACAGCLRLSQAKALPVLAAAALRVGRVSPANVGRAAVGTAAHRIERGRRSCADERVEAADAMRGVGRRLVGKRKQPLLVAPDRVDIRGCQGPAASAVLAGRSVPLCRASTRGHAHAGARARRAREPQRRREGSLLLLLLLLLLALRSMVPARVKAILPADRGFGRASPAAFLPPPGVQPFDPHRARGDGEAHGLRRQAPGPPGEAGCRHGAPGRRPPRRRGGDAARGTRHAARGTRWCGGSPGCPSGGTSAGS